VLVPEVMTSKRIFITGSADGLGLLAARQLIAQGHQVALHARSDARAHDARAAIPDNLGVAVGDLSSLAETRAVAKQANALGRFDAVIHNAGIYTGRGETADGLSRMFAVNVAAPYVLTALIDPPERLIYLSSGLHRGGHASLTAPKGTSSYADTKLFVVALAFAVARARPDARSNAVDPGWVPTKMGGPSAPDDLDLGAATQAWLAASDEPGAAVSGRYFHHQQIQQPHSAAEDTAFQDQLIAYCADLTGVVL
jgi:NAD(P)-dependent dehydrogenase (short-subunit alcohol dehydrogenase family)